MGPGLAFLSELMGPPKIDTTGVVMTLPTITFEKSLTVHVGDKEVRLVNVGPAHTGGDVIAYVPADKTVFTGDILFIEGHPIMWAGPTSNWIDACNLILGWDVETIVPGHGPVTDKNGVRVFRDYLAYIDAETRKRHAAGMSPDEAANDIALDAYANWLDAERVMVNVRTIYRSLRGEAGEEPIPLLFGKMAEYHQRHRSGEKGR
jgi:glyoxylase-like metal-dependent hydrolase (beta-lactamase superfamily II)